MYNDASVREILVHISYSVTYKMYTLWKNLHTRRIQYTCTCTCMFSVSSMYRGDERKTHTCTFKREGVEVRLAMICTRLPHCLCAETGGITIAPRPAPDDSPPKPGYPSIPFFGIQPELRSENVSYLVLLLTSHSWIPIGTY